MLQWDTIELGFERFLELLRANAAAWSELEASRGEFFVDALAARSPGSERRLLEWFLLERPSAVLGGVPVQVWQEVWRAGGGLDGADPEEFGAAFLYSLPGAYVVTSLAPGEGLWVRDLFTQGEHPLLEVDASPELEVGDLLVGRLFPAGGGAYLASPAVSVFRNRTLLEAVQRDLEGMRAARRGVLRIQQLELEHLFHGPGQPRPEGPTLEARRQDGRQALSALGLAPEVVDGILARVQRGARAGDDTAVAETLNGLAFETGVDLASARLVLADLWEGERALARSDPRAGVAKHDGDAEADENGHAAEGQSAEAARVALAAFDRGRRAGQDLEQLFQTLERDLGIAGEDPPTEPDDAGVPDFPGVVGAMIEEFLWEVGREQGAEQASRWSVLRELGTFARDLGVFDELGSVQLLDFSARWVLDESAIRSPEQTEVLFDALAAFCRWCEDGHDLPLWRQFGSTLDGLRSSVPRLLVLRSHASAGAGTGAYEIVRIAPGAALVRDEQGLELTVPVSPLQEPHLRDGDLVRLARKAGSLVVGSAYPREIASFLRR